MTIILMDHGYEWMKRQYHDGLLSQEDIVAALGADRGKRTIERMHADFKCERDEQTLSDWISAAEQATAALRYFKNALITMLDNECREPHAGYFDAAMRTLIEEGVDGWAGSSPLDIDKLVDTVRGLEHVEDTRSTLEKVFGKLE